MKIFFILLEKIIINTIVLFKFDSSITIQIYFYLILFQLKNCNRQSQPILRSLIGLKIFSQDIKIYIFVMKSPDN